MLLVAVHIGNGNGREHDDAVDKVQSNRRPPPLGQQEQSADRLHQTQRRRHDQQCAEYPQQRRRETDERPRFGLPAPAHKICRQTRKRRQSRGDENERNHRAVQAQDRVRHQSPSLPYPSDGRSGRPRSPRTTILPARTPRNSRTFRAPDSAAALLL